MYQEPKYPRIRISGKRHKQLTIEAQKEKTTLELLVEARLKLADKFLKDLKKNEKAGIIN